MNIERRLEKLEKQTGANKPESKTWVLVKGDPEPEGIEETDLIIRVSSEKVKELTLRIMEGENTS